MAEEIKEEKPQEPIEKPEEAKKPEEVKEPEEAKVLDTHGQPGINKERHEKEVNALKETIKELEGKLAEMVKTEAGREDMGKEIAALKEQIAENELVHKLEMARCRNTKAAKALLSDYENDVAKLKEAEPWLFAEEKQTGSTGAKPTGAPTAEDAIENELRRAAGLKPKG